MDRTVLLLLCLQVFLLITAFTSTDAAALVTDDQQQQQQQSLGPVEGISAHNFGKSRQKRQVRNCSQWIGGCSAPRPPGTGIKKIPQPTDPAFTVYGDPIVEVRAPRFPGGGSAPTDV